MIMFFTELNRIMQEGQILNLNLLKKGDKLYVCVVPKVQNMSEAATNKLIPLNLSGTPTELDQEFFTVINEPVQERFGVISNSDAFKQNTKSANSKNGGDPLDGNKGNNLSKRDRRIAEAEAHEKSKRWPEAYAIYKKLSEADPNDPKMKEKTMQVWGKMSQRPLFNFDEEQEPMQVDGEGADANEETDMNYDNGKDHTSEIEEPVKSESNTTIVKEVFVNMGNVPNQNVSKNPEDMFASIAGMANLM